MKEKPKYNMWQNTCFLFRWTWRHCKSLFALNVAGVCTYIFRRLLELFIAPSVVKQLETHAALPNLIATILSFTLAMVIISWINSFAKRESQVAQGILNLKIGDAINQKACRISYPETQDPKTIKLLENAFSATKGVFRNVWDILKGIAINIAGIIIYCVFLIRLEWWIPVIIVLASVVGFYFNRHLNEWDFRHREERARYYTRMNYIVKKSEGFELAKDIRIFGLHDWLKDIYQDARNRLKAFLHKKGRNDIWSNIFQIVFDLARNAIAYIVLIRMCLEDGMAASEFLLYFSAISGFSEWITGVFRHLAMYHEKSLKMSSVQEYLNKEEQFQFASGKSVTDVVNWELELTNVSFRYPGSDTCILKNFNLTIRAGEKLSIVGLNGAGKTTLIKLLCGFYDPTEGCVRLNGTDIREFDRQSYYRIFSAVFQDYSLLDLTIAETVAQTCEEIDIARVHNCLEKASILEWVNTLPQGIETHIGKNVYDDGIHLSGGQIQRLLLARALYKNGSILILDEPTSALDPIAEHKIYCTYNDLTHHKTAIFISHRLASTRFCDRIIFLEKGQIKEEGTHESLIQKNGAYAQLFAVQSQYYQEEGDLIEK